MLRFNNIELFLGHQKPALTVKSLKIDTGLWALVGRNGSGKTTFLNTISGFNENYKGKILLNNIDLKSIPKIDLAKQISVVMSKTEIFGDLTGLDVLFLGRLPYQNLLGKISDKDKDIVNNVIHLLDLNPLTDKPFAVMSDGEKQLIMIGRALVQDTPIIILDEPTAFLDVVNRKKIVKLLHQIRVKQNKLIIFSTHNIDLIEEFCDNLLLIHHHCIHKVTNNQNFKVELTKLFNHEV